MMPTNATAASPMRTSNVPGTDRSSGRNVQKVVVVNGNPRTLSFAETTLESGHYDVVFVESIAHAYSQIRRVQPNLVIMCLRLDDPDGFRLLSMLKLDPDTQAIPVLTYTSEQLQADQTDDEETEEEEPESSFFAPRATTLMN